MTTNRKTRRADFWLLVQPNRGPSSLEIDYPGTPAAFAVFTTERKARAYCKARPTPDWILFTVPRSELADLIADAKHVVVDPSSDGKQGRVLSNFQALVELC